MKMSGGETHTEHHRKGGRPMTKKKKGGDQDPTLAKLVLITAILNLIKVILDLIEKLLE